MFCFYQQSDKIVNTPVNILNGGSSGLGFNVMSVPMNRKPLMREVYITGNLDGQRYLDMMNARYNKEDFKFYEVPQSSLASIKMPFMIGANTQDGFRNDIEIIEAVEAIFKEEKRKITIAVVSSAETAVGDLLCLISVLKKMNNEIKKRNIPVEFVLFKTAVALRSGFMAMNIWPELKQKMMPVSIEEIQSFDFLIEISGFLSMKEANEIDFHELYAKTFSFNLPDDFNPVGDFMPCEHQKNLARKKMNDFFGNKKPILSLNSESSTILRTMPKKIKEEIINKLLATEKFNIASFDPFSKISDIKHPNYAVFSPYTVNFEDYAAFLSVTDGIISVDSAPLHLAARLDIPSYGIFTSIKPNLRTKYYRKSDSVFIGEDYDGLHTKKEMSEEEIDKLWSKLDIDDFVKKVTKKFKKSFF